MAERTLADRWLRRLDVAAASLALAILAWATIFAGDAAARSTAFRVILFVVWSTAVIYLGFRTAITDAWRDRTIGTMADAVDDFSAARLEERLSARLVSAEMLLAGAIANELPGAGWEWSVSMLGDDGRRMVPFHPKELAVGRAAKVRSFPRGKGAVGVAWDRPGVFAFYGDEVSDHTHGLTADQRALFAGYRTVAATAILDENDVCIGVLSGMSVGEDRHFDAPSEKSHLATVARVMAPMLSAYFADVRS